jgi:lysophospholipase L1-like esterase
VRDTSPARIGAIGASISSNGTLSMYDRTHSGAVSLGALSYLAYALPQTHGRFVLGGIAATPGHNSQQMIDDHLTDVLNSTWDYVIVGEMTNDLGDGLPLATTRDHVSTIIDAIEGVGKTPILTTLTPWDDVATDPAKNTWITAYNVWITQEAQRRALACVDYHTPMSDPANNGPIVGLTSDGLHPSAAGARVMGDTLAAVLNSLPVPAHQPLAGAYNPNLLVPDVCRTSTGADKATGSGPTYGGWALKTATDPNGRWKGAQTIISRGGGDYSLRWGIDPTRWVAGHKVRLAFALDAASTIANGKVNAYLYNLTQMQVVAGLTGIPAPFTNNSISVTDAVITAGSNQVTSAAKPFRPDHVGHAASAAIGLTTPLPAGTTVTGISPDGGTAHLSANATAAQTGSHLTLSGEPLVVVFELDVQSDMVGDDIRFYATTSGATGNAAAVIQPTVYDITALEAA